MALVLWPIATRGSTPDPATEPWIWYLVNVATIAGVLAFPFALQIAWTILLPLAFGAVRLIQGGFGGDYWIPVLLDVSFALILGGIILALAWLFRRIAANVDETRMRAVESYAAAAAADAAEEERIAVAALMHDSVLAALIAAERAHTDRESALAATMAREALTRLANAEQDPEEGTDEPTDAATIADQIEKVAHELGVEVKAERTILGDHPTVPGRVARALSLAAMQAITNAVEHADGEGLAVSVRAVPDPVRVRIEVRDNGGGLRTRQTCRTTGSASGDPSSRGSRPSEARRRSPRASAARRCGSSGGRRRRDQRPRRARGARRRLHGIPRRAGARVDGARSPTRS